MKTSLHRLGSLSGISLIETVIAMLIVTVTIAGTINGYILAANRAEWSAYSLAAHSLVVQKHEQIRAATWNRTGEVELDQLTAANFPATKSVLDLPMTGSNYVTAEISTAITVVSTSPALKAIRVDCVWPYRERGNFTNTIVTYRSPEQ